MPVNFSSVTGERYNLLTFDLISLTLHGSGSIIMKAYKELSLDIGRSKLLHQVGAGGTETSHAGKMKASRGTGRRPGAHRSWVDAVSGRDLLSE